MVMRCKLKQTGYSFICNLYYPFMTGISQNLCNCIYFIAKYSNIFQIIANKHEKFIFIAYHIADDTNHTYCPFGNL
jgi:hypothetical protein